MPRKWWKIFSTVTGRPGSPGKTFLTPLGQPGRDKKRFLTVPWHPNWMRKESPSPTWKGFWEKTSSKTAARQLSMAKQLSRRTEGHAAPTFLERDCVPRNSRSRELNWKGAVRAPRTTVSDYAIRQLRGMSFPPMVDERTGSLMVSAGSHKSTNAFAHGLFLTGAFLAHELLTAQSLSLYFGGGYEIATWVNGRFVKLPEATFLYWDARRDGTKISLNLKQVVKYKYVEDFLLIRTAVFERRAAQEYKLRVTHRVNIVPPVNKWISQFPRNVALPPFQSDWLCNYFVQVPRTGEPVFCHVHRIGNVSGSPLLFSEDAQSLTVGVKNDFFESLIRQFIQGPSPPL
jgi:hypothetical protein